MPNTLVRGSTNKTSLWFLTSTHFMPMISFYTPWKHVFGKYRKGPMAWNGWKLINLFAKDFSISIKNVYTYVMRWDNQSLYFFHKKVIPNISGSISLQFLIAYCITRFFIQENHFFCLSLNVLHIMLQIRLRFS